MTDQERIRAFYDKLHAKYGPQGWWPGETPFECVIGAILTQNTSWSNVEKAIGNLKSNRVLSEDKINELTTEELARLIRPAGYYNQKALNIKLLIGHLFERHGGKLENMFKAETHEIREELLSQRGIGPETADSILLYAARRPVFVVDAYTYRIFSRHGLIPFETSYHEIQESLTTALTEDASVYNEYHALIVKLGKEHCRKSEPICRNCPLEYDPHSV